jgi:hypothetical protein
LAPFAGSRKPYFEIRESPIQGKGAFAIRRIPKDTRILEYIGELIDEDEADIRYPDEDMERHHTFLFAIDGGRIIDGGPVEWPSKYINHSCDPNCEAIEEDDGRVYVHAKRTIQPGTELTYDYAYERTEATTEADERMYVCYCGAKNCRGTILKDPPAKKRRAAAKKRSARKAAGRKAAGRKVSARKVSARKASARKASARKTGTRGTTTRTRTTSKTKTKTRTPAHHVASRHAGRRAGTR